MIIRQIEPSELQIELTEGWTVFRQIEQQIISRCRAQLLSVDDLLPRVQELANFLQVPADQCSQAYSLLRHKGYIRRVGHRHSIKPLPDASMHQLVADKTTHADTVGLVCAIKGLTEIVTMRYLKAPMVMAALKDLREDIYFKELLRAMSKV